MPKQSKAGSRRHGQARLDNPLTCPSLPPSLPPYASQVLAAIPSDEACDVALTALQKGKHLKIDYKVTSVVITVTDRTGSKKVSRLKWA